MGTGEVCSYRLRRTGPTPTCSNVSDILILKNGITTFGRANNNDFYLDSSRLKNFISRLHAEIHCIKSDDGDYEFHLHDKGLNGTFVNDRKMDGPHVLEEGDVITFGHTNGFKLKPGDFAKQPNSEFQFVFERLIEKEEESGARTGDIPGVKSNSPRNDTANTNGYLSNQLPGNRRESCANSKLSLQKEKTDVYGTSSSPTHRKNSGIHGNTSSAKTSSLDCVSSDSESRKKHQKKFRNLSPNKNNDHQRNGTGFRNLTDFDDEDSIDKRINIVRTSPKGKKRKTNDNVIDANKNTSSKRNSLEKLSEDLDDLPSIGSCSSLSNDDDNSMPADPFAFPMEENSNGITAKKKKKRGPIKRKSNSTDTKHNTSIKKKKATPKAPAQKPVVAKKKKGGKGGKRGRRKKSESSDDNSDDDDDDFEKQEDDLEEGVEWYEEEACTAPDCKRPTQKPVAWVQCDDCDQWYHTECVGCRYEHVKDSNIKFSCGCR